MAKPSFRAAPVRVRVPATSANLGPGFDAAGLALGLYDDVVVRIADAGLQVDVAGEGAETLRRDGRHLVVKALRAAFDLLGGQPRGLEVVCANRIPQGRGLGSSSAAIVAGVVAAGELVLGGLDDDAALQLATALEGHPDNVAACLRGGLTWCYRGPSGVAVASLPVSPDLAPVALVPTSKQSTSKARGLLPESVPHAVAATGAGAAGLLPTALAGRFDLLMAATDDVLHQPFRLPSQPRSEALLGKLRQAGIAAVLSGSGSTVLALCTSGAQAQQAVSLAPRGFEAWPLPVVGGAEVVPL